MKIVSFIDEKAVIETQSPGMGEEHAEGALKAATRMVAVNILRHCELWRENIPRPPPTKNYVAFGGPKQEQGDLPIANAGPLLDYSFFEQTCA